MNLKKILLVAGLGIMISNVSAQTSRRYTVAKPGTLVEMLTEEEANEITHLVLQGKLNAVDFRHLRDEFKKLQILDISNASISMYAGKNGTHPDRFLQAAWRQHFCRKNILDAGNPFRQDQEHRRRCIQGMHQPEDLPHT